MTSTLQPVGCNAEVMRDRLRTHLQDLGGENGTITVPEAVERELEEAFNSGYRTAVGTLDGSRYHRLLDAIEDFRDNPPTTPAASKPAWPTTVKMVNRAYKRLRRAQKDARKAVDGPDHDAALHQVRKDAKRLRHAAESASVLHGKKADKLANAAPCCRTCCRTLGHVPPDRGLDLVEELVIAELILILGQIPKGL